MVGACLPDNAPRSAISTSFQRPAYPGLAKESKGIQYRPVERPERTEKFVAENTTNSIERITDFYRGIDAAGENDPFLWTVSQQSPVAVVQAIAGLNQTCQVMGQVQQLLGHFDAHLMTMNR